MRFDRFCLKRIFLVKTLSLIDVTALKTFEINLFNVRNAIWQTWPWYTLEILFLTYLTACNLWHALSIKKSISTDLAGWNISKTFFKRFQYMSISVYLNAYNSWDTFFNSTQLDRHDLVNSILHKNASY